MAIKSPIPGKKEKKAAKAALPCILFCQCVTLSGGTRK